MVRVELHWDDPTSDRGPSGMTPSQKTLIATSLFACVVALTAFALLEWASEYEQGNYRAAFSSAAQLLGVSLGILIGAFLLAGQIIERISPLAVRIVRRTTLLGILLFESFVVALDLFLLVVLPPAVDRLHLLTINIGLALNVAAVLAVIPYGLAVLNWINVESLARNVVESGRKDSSLKGRLEIIRSLEEMLFWGSERRQTHTCTRILESFSDLATIIATSGDNDPNLIRKNPDHPVRELLETLGRIGQLLSDLRTEDVIPRIADLAGSIARTYDQVGLAEHLDVELSMSITRTIEACARNGQEWTIYNLWANMTEVMKVWVEEDLSRRSRILLYMLGTLEDALDTVSRYDLNEALYFMIESVEKIALHFQKYGGPTQTMHGGIVKVSPTAELLALVSAAKRSSHGRQQLVGKYGKRPILDIITSVQRIAAQLEVKKSRGQPKRKEGSQCNGDTQEP